MKGDTKNELQRIVDEEEQLLEKIADGKFVQVKTPESDYLVLANIEETQHGQILSRFLKSKNIPYSDDQNNFVPQPNGERDSYRLIGAGSYEIDGERKRLIVEKYSVIYRVGPEITSLKSIVGEDLPGWSVENFSGFKE